MQSARGATPNARGTRKRDKRGWGGRRDLARVDSRGAHRVQGLGFRV